MSQRERFDTIEEACAFLGISQSKIYKLMGNGDLEFVSIGGRRMIPRKSLMALGGSQSERTQPEWCKAGLHALTEDNVGVWRNRWWCKACRRIADTERAAREKELQRQAWEQLQEVVGT